MCLEKIILIIIQFFKNITNDKNSLNDKLQYLRKVINKFNTYANSIINAMNDAKENIEKYQIANKLIYNYEIKNKNYQVLFNANKFITTQILDDIQKVICSNSYNSLIQNIMDIYNKI